MNCEKRDAYTIERIAEAIYALDDTYEKLESAGGRTMFVFEQENAIREIRFYICEAKKADRLDRRWALHTEERVDACLKNDSDALAEITWHFNMLDKTLSSPDINSSRIRGFFEQKKTLHEVKRILHYIGKYDRYDEKELNGLCISN